MQPVSTSFLSETSSLKITKFVFSESIKCLLNPFVVDSHYGWLKIVDVIEWMYPWCSFSDPSQKHRYSFPNVCSRLDLDPFSVQQFCVDALSGNLSQFDPCLKRIHKSVGVFLVDLRRKAYSANLGGWLIPTELRLYWIFSPDRRVEFYDGASYQKDFLPYPGCTFGEYLEYTLRLDLRRQRFVSSLVTDSPQELVNHGQLDFFTSPDTSLRAHRDTSPALTSSSTHLATPGSLRT
jgi:hypothetical protein